MKRVFLILTLLLSLPTVAAELLSPEVFTQRYLKQLTKTYPDAETEITDEMAVSVKLGDGNEFTSYLTNAYNSYRNDPDALGDILTAHIRALERMSKHDDSHQDRSALVPVIKDIRFINNIKEMADTGQKGDKAVPAVPYYERLNSELYILYAFDSEFSVSFATEASLKELGIEKGDIRQLAVTNMMERLPELQRQGDDSLSMLMADGYFEASLLLIDDIWHKENFNVDGDIVVFVPTRDVVLVTGSNDTTGLLQAQEIVNSNDWPYAISSYGFVRKNGGWERLLPQ